MSVIFTGMALKGATTEDTYFNALEFLIERFYINLKNDRYSLESITSGNKRCIFFSDYDSEGL